MAAHRLMSEPLPFMIQEFKATGSTVANRKIDGQIYRRAAGSVAELIVMPNYSN